MTTAPEALPESRPELRPSGSHSPLSPLPSRAKLAWILIWYVGLTAAHALALRYLALVGVSAEDTLIFRGLGCLATATLLALLARQSLMPNKPGLQLARFFFSGFALWLLTAAYQYANATTVTMISRLDTAILMIAGPLIGVAASTGQRMLALASVVLLGSLAIWGGGAGGEQALGYGLAFLGTAGVTVGYLFLRSSGKSENTYVVAGIAGVAIAFYGVVGRLLHVGHPSTIDPLAMGVLLAAGIMMYAIYDLTLRLYKIMDITLAEYPTLFAALLVMPAEILMFQVHFDALYVAAMVGNVVLLGAILAMGRKKTP